MSRKYDPIFNNLRNDPLVTRYYILKAAVEQAIWDYFQPMAHADAVDMLDSTVGRVAPPNFSGVLMDEIASYVADPSREVVEWNSVLGPIWNWDKAVLDWNPEESIHRYLPSHETRLQIANLLGVPLDDNFEYHKHWEFISRISNIDQMKELFEKRLLPALQGKGPQMEMNIPGYGEVYGRLKDYFPKEWRLKWLQFIRSEFIPIWVDFIDDVENMIESRQAPLQWEDVRDEALGDRRVDRVRERQYFSDQYQQLLASGGFPRPVARRELGASTYQGPVPGDVAHKDYWVGQQVERLGTFFTL